MLPVPTLPDLALWREALPWALSFALLGAIESLLSAVVADGMSGARHRSNAELVAQGVANIGSGLVGGFCVTGTIARTATNVRAGSKGPISGILHSLFLLAFLIVAAPLAAGVVVLLGPLRKPAADGSWVQLTKLGQLQVGGAPRLFQVYVARTDAWTRHGASAVGSVYLERTGEKDVTAFSTSCPHLGCAVVWQDPEKRYFCPCHDSAFARDGAIIQPSPSARALDTLLVEIRNGDEVWVRFQDFKAGIKEKIPVA